MWVENFSKDIDTKKKGSNFWNNVLNTWEEFRSNLVWNVGNGEDVHFWKDNWLPNCDLLEACRSTSISNDDANLPIIHFMSYNGEWNWGLIENLLPMEIIQKISSYPPPSFLCNENSYGE